MPAQPLLFFFLLLLGSPSLLIHGLSFQAEHIIVDAKRLEPLVLSTATHQCPLSPFPSGQWPMFGGQVDSRPTICTHGRDYGDMSKCYQYIDRRWSQTFQMPESIMSATSTQINKGSDMWVASGRMTPKGKSWPQYTNKTYIVQGPQDIQPGIDLPYHSRSPQLLHFSGEKVLYVAPSTDYRLWNKVLVSIIDLDEVTPTWTSLTPYTRVGRGVRYRYFVVAPTSGNTEPKLFAFSAANSYYSDDVTLTSQVLDLATNQWSTGPSATNSYRHFSTVYGHVLFFEGEVYVFGNSMGLESFDRPVHLDENNKIEGLHFPLENGSGKWTGIKNTAKSTDSYFLDYVSCSGMVDC
ncbi:hypothetical protein TCAL_17388 [Tigriopus californicus]|uniref:Uncharacterized protein n=1 Tax=Tigriopus californicus TaxID=6832 RepID=A0A553NNF5_TIGCA|nr:uncharacterized protein LOC131878978 [Tigriopus californicus]TRY66983.1 hypothetical protein TCAL_17388 [Tigriopus californicus]|eukprot:TCALIF_05160-PA protein Name:"Protein of unknown function" AED:0.00 eAED:0.00 QI:207/1/1/1/0/0.5/2/28/350